MSDIFEDWGPFPENAKTVDIWDGEDYEAVYKLEETEDVGND
jgi:hypothetical protein